ncbi:AAA family ATPase [Solirubrobacter phytolaccae]|uniref:AAA family ATPase n=1 Tax=Solirubrobacter phytolaccae TaxID=1404360 RepID=A0A9X3NCE2_9ACTN|nr:AAA family ATPase [Solirubrobacter phytolaccae]
MLTGMSGTGKTWLAEAYADAIDAEHLVVPVAPNWSSNEDLLGFWDPFQNAYRHTAFSGFLLQATEEHDRAVAERRKPRPFHVVLDEMNLARVEFYFAKFLSAMEVRARTGTATLELAPSVEVKLTRNFVFIGTVNMDETTNGFADKVLDRAQLIEIEAREQDIYEHLEGRPYQTILVDVWRSLVNVAPFAFRVLDEIGSYVDEADAVGVAWEEALDEQVLQKVLPKVRGASPLVGPALLSLVSLDEALPETATKARQMLTRFEQHGVTSYF